ncbi:BgTH12-01567 [Blumeria graminis f. sp. triticale]|uniref:Uncharacterized protein n=4 Tax=Blumeria graminis TaxID=34373 RepID=A0A656KF79_BLUGR|nr:hypothetical protein BGT96224_2756 [Blumeria graminis f. sp. tritici 96224]CAD6501315.1 BgTH12-01567 [Blumeria graminis f. sp. triticale]VDB83766.1 Bgt-2756 [Blumeria graminis f. sp. tritici]
MPREGKKSRAFKQSSPPELNCDVPFSKAPSSLTTLLSKLEKSCIYITHIDKKPKDFKLKIFMVPLLTNVVIIGLLLWRVKAIGPWYIRIIWSLLGHPNELTVNVAQSSMSTLSQEIFQRFLVFMIDLILYLFLWHWPREFFAGSRNGNPFSWRLAIGFREKEIVVRRSRISNFDFDRINEIEEDKKVLLYMIQKAIDPLYMNDKTGYMMINKEWDLDWNAMSTATSLIDKNTLSFDDFKTTAILLHSKKHGWLTFKSCNTTVDRDEGRNVKMNIIKFRDELNAMGKESLFIKWVKLVEEASQTGDFGAEQQNLTMAKVKVMFENEKVDFEKIWAKASGPDEVISNSQN